MPRTHSKANRQRAGQYLLSAGVAGGLGGDETGAALRTMLLGSMALGNLYLQRIVLDPLSGGGKEAATSIPANFHKISASLLAMSRTLGALPGDPTAVGQTRPFEELSVYLAEASEKLEVEIERGGGGGADPNDDWDSVTELERAIFARAGITPKNDKYAGEDDIGGKAIDDN